MDRPLFGVRATPRRWGRQRRLAQSQALAAALKRAGTPVEIRALEGRGLRGHMQINRQMGDPAYPGTAVVDDWLARVFR